MIICFDNCVMIALLSNLGNRIRKSVYPINRVKKFITFLLKIVGDKTFIKEGLIISEVCFLLSHKIIIFDIKFSIVSFQIYLIQSLLLVIRKHYLMKTVK